jgi:hypothetical protein
MPRKPANLSGMRFGKLLAQELHPVRRHGKVYWLCVCDCGVEKPVRAELLVRGESTSCGSCRDPNVAHGMTKSPTWVSWRAMIERCTKPSHQAWEYYGGRGISVCSDWMGPGGFSKFVGHVGARPSTGHSIDRIDGSLGYVPGNVRWATAAEQARNMRTNIRLTAFGTTKTISEWAREYGLSFGCIKNRVARGMDHERAVSTPSRPGKKSAAK